MRSQRCLRRRTLAAALALLAGPSVARATAPECLAPYTPIPAIQGSGATAALVGPVVTQGVVVGDFEGPAGLRGFYLQDPAGDGDPATSDALFVYQGDADSVSLGDAVRVTGVAAEHQGQTEIVASALAPCGRAELPEPAELLLPRAAAGDLERLEGMRVRLPQTLTVTDVYGLGRFGEVTLASSGRLWRPTQLVPPGPLAAAVAAANDLDRLLLDDTSLRQDPDPIPWARDGAPLSAENPLRAGDRVTGVAGVLGYGWGGAPASPNAWRVRPAGAPAPGFAAANPRPATPLRVGGRLRAAGVNLYNYFDSFGPGACRGGVAGPALDCRGASSPAEFGRQWRKTVALLTALGADLVAASELENDGYGPESAIQHLVARLDEANAPGAWRFVDADAGTGRLDALGSDAIRVALLYRAAALAPAGPPAVLATGAFGPFETTGGTIQRNRPALAQSFVERASGECFTAVVVHLKSRGSSCRGNRSPVGSDPDTEDGQGHCALTRLAAAAELAAWLAGDPTGSGDPDLLLLGDWNAYPREDPIALLLAAGYADLLAPGSGAGPYSYGFAGEWGRLDHALASPSLAAQVAAAATWPGNADEPPVLGYEAGSKSPAQIASLYAPDAFRASDHDPVVVGLALPEPAASARLLAALATLARLARARASDTDRSQTGAGRRERLSAP
ncbi:MAG TPA: ExeM/NucH family extracellular endonuclease [Myxococcota bacterium]|nr:ExeM/NucH family extracellular endonuclease [Myxococcota bacterium]